MDHRTVVYIHPVQGGFTLSFKALGALGPELWSAAAARLQFPLERDSDFSPFLNAHCMIWTPFKNFLAPELESSKFSMDLSRVGYGMYGLQDRIFPNKLPSD